MKINSTEYRLWIKHRNEKNLRRRTRKKQYKKLMLTRQQQHNVSIKQNYNYSSKNRVISFSAPPCFSLMNNANETILFFKDIIKFITDKRNFGKKIFINIYDVKELTIDALMYLLAIVKNLKRSFRDKFTFSGNSPENAEVRKLFNESGFYNYVNYHGTDTIIENNNNIQIVSGNNSNTNVAKRILDFVIEKADVPTRKCSFLYDMLIELMSNSQKHAYNSKELLIHNWYCFAKYDKADTISFIFMDTGAGIPSTVKKNFFERIKILNLKNDSSFVESALKGEFRTATKQPNRGKGLPKIREYCMRGRTRNLRIITNHADVCILNNTYRSANLSEPIIGTLYYWDISISNLKGA